MSTVQFSQLKRINDLLKQVDILKEKIAKLETEVGRLQTHYQEESKRYKTKLETEHKQRMQLEKIEVEINELKTTEYHLLEGIFQSIDKALDHYFDKSGYQQFVIQLLQSLDSSSTKYTIHADKNHQQLLPKDTAVASEKGFFVETEITDLILDPAQLKPILRESLLKTKVPQAIGS